MVILQNKVKDKTILPFTFLSPFGKKESRQWGKIAAYYRALHSHPYNLPVNKTKI